MEKLLRVLVLLSGIRNYSRAEIAEQFNTSERTVYRYLCTIENAGFVLERREGRYRLITENINGKTLEKLLHFSEEEAWLLYQTLSELKAGYPLKERLVKKLHILYDFKALSRLEKANELERGHSLGEAINHKKLVILHQYRSSNSGAIANRQAPILLHHIKNRTPNSGAIANRQVEPFEFMEDYKAAWCYDPEDKSNKQFKTARMGKVELLSSAWQYETEHRTPFTDAFRMAADKPLATVEALLSLKAFNLLTEEYPLAEKYITKEKSRYRLKIPIADYHGIGRFVMGLPGEVEVLEPEGFKEFLEGKRKKFGATDRI